LAGSGQAAVVRDKILANRLGSLCLTLALAVWGGGCAGVGAGRKSPRAVPLRGTFGTYDAAPRQADGRVDVGRLTGELEVLRANTYNWLIWHAPTDWEDLQRFLPRAREKQIRVWVTLVPPSESPPRTKNYSEPFRLDYERWAVEIAQLSLREPNLVAWSLDDFSHNTRTFAPAYLRRVLEAARQINPKLAFVPCCYYRHVTPAFAETYRPWVDGVLFPYRNESGEMNLQNSGAVESEVSRLKELFGREVPVFVDVYATKHSRLNDSTPQYVREVMTAARRCADGVLVYCHQNEATSPEKHGVIKELFHEWSRQ